MVLLLLVIISVAGCVQDDTGTDTTGDAVAECSKGVVNDPFPGNCEQYIDEDGNGICDRSE